MVASFNYKRLRFFQGEKEEERERERERERRGGQDFTYLLYPIFIVRTSIFIVPFYCQSVRFQ